MQTRNEIMRSVPPLLTLANIYAQSPEQLCGICKVITPDRNASSWDKDDPAVQWLDYERIDYYPSLPGLAASASAGCGLCRMFRETILENWGNPHVAGLEEHRPVRIADVHFVSEQFERRGKAASLDAQQGRMIYALTMTVTLHDSEGPDEETHDISMILCFACFDTLDLNSSMQQHRRRLPSLSTLSDENVQLMKRWIQECQSNHRACYTLPDIWMPTRLLDVGSDDESGSKMPRLIETANTLLDSRTFIALSHMWGDMTVSPPLRSIRSNYETMKDGVAPSSLPRNFADAVSVCRCLGVRYIWIDSLCIIQDSPEDWAHEAKLMHKVYRNAVVTVVATSATSSHDGFLQRHIASVSAVRLSYSLGNSGCQSLIVCPNEYAQGRMGPNPELEVGINCSRWNTRGWTMQERILSTRLIHFCKNLICFECRTCMVTEENVSMAWERDDAVVKLELWPRSDHIFREPKTAGPSHLAPDMEALYKKWMATLEEYSFRQLTKQSDKLPAMQSIAAEMSLVVDDTYIPFAGMWLGNLKRELLWQSLPPLPIQRPESYGAPSWSWASAGSDVRWLGKKLDNGIEMPTIQYSFDVLDHGSQHPKCKAHNYLEVEGFTKSISRIVPTDSSSSGSSSWRSVEYYFPFSLQVVDSTGAHVKFGSARLDLKDYVPREGAQLLYLHITERYPPGLLLERSDTTEPIWFRIGIASIFTVGAGKEIGEILFTGGNYQKIIII